MEKILRFRGTQIGDIVLKQESCNRVETPLIVQTGLYQALGAPNADSTNRVYRQRFTLKLKRDTAEACAQEIHLIQLLQNLQGDVLVLLGGALAVRMDQWWCELVSEPTLLPAHGGRFTDQLEVTFIGNSPPRWL